MVSDKKILRALYSLIILSALVRGFVAAFIELGNDEVYYWTYALFPDTSHFDHPPMVGWMIQLFTWNLTFDNEFFIRLASIVLGTVNTYLMFYLGKTIKDSLAGFYAALLYTTSIYCTVIAGTFILPDAPQVLFWLSGMIMLVKVLRPGHIEKKWMLLAGLFIGLAMISKYHAILLWACTLAYITFFNKKWFTYWQLYGALLISFLVFLPVLIWNYQNEFISFTFQGDRVDIFKSGLNMDYFRREIFGQFLYNNPVNFVLIIISIIALIRGQQFIQKEYSKFLLMISLPIILLFLLFSLFRSTLPHWSGPAYLALLIITASHLSYKSQKKLSHKILIPRPIMLSLVFISILIILGFGQINYGWIHLKGNRIKDVTIEMYGWESIGTAFKEIYKKDMAMGIIDSNTVIISHRWFPAAHIDYYIAYPLQINVFGLGDLERIHKYAWINEKRGGLKVNQDAYFITTRFDYANPLSKYPYLFDSIIPTDTIEVIRGGEKINEAYIYLLKGLKIFPTVLPKEDHLPI
ncbi:ArnT family glycosyltransferase [candidate division KSB1 bacterium]